MTTDISRQASAGVARAVPPAPGFVERSLESWVFGHRVALLLLFAGVSVFLLFQAMKLQLDVSFQNMVPTHHPYIANYLQYESELRPLGNVVRIAVEARQGDIYSRDYLETLKKV